jgi:hypothetical protein
LKIFKVCVYDQNIRSHTNNYIYIELKLMYKIMCNFARLIVVFKHAHLNTHAM